jgi:hypothetical protein
MLSVTKEMNEAGKAMASNLMTATVVKSFNGMGGSITWEDWGQKDIPNKDIIQMYLDEVIDSVTAIYLAMEKARK